MQSQSPLEIAKDAVDKLVKAQEENIRLTDQIKELLDNAGELHAIIDQRREAMDRLSGLVNIYSTLNKILLEKYRALDAENTQLRDAVAAEREACAVEAERVRLSVGGEPLSGFDQIRQIACEDTVRIVAAAIRDRATLEPEE